MTKQYGFIQQGQVHEVINIEDGSPPIEERYHPDFVACMIEITPLIPQPQVGWLFNLADGRFYEALGTDLTPPVAPFVAGNTEPPITDNTDPRAFFDNALVV